MDEVLAQSPKGYLPPKYKYFPNATGASFATFQEYVDNQGGDAGSTVNIRLSGVIRVRDLTYEKSDKTLVYSGRGILICSGTEPGADAKFLASVKARDSSRDHLTLVYDLPAGDGTNRTGQIILGKIFQGTVYSSWGVRPNSGSSTVILGNLVCRHLNKGLIDDDSVLVVNYDLARFPVGSFDNPRNWWVHSISPRPAASTTRSN